jgi:hypothetical protein
VKRRAVAGASLACALLQSAPSVAAPSATELQLHGCESLSENALREHLELELTTLQLQEVGAVLRLRCDGTSVVIALGRASGARYPVEVRVELRDTAKAARERLVALAASELVAQAERQAPSSAPPPADVAVDRRKSSSESTRDTVEVKRLPASPRPPVELFVAGSAASTGTPRALLWGGALGTRWGLSRRWSVLFDTRFERGDESVRLARVRFTSLSGLVGTALNAKAGPLALSAGLGVRAGWLSLAASADAPNEGLSFTAPWAGVAAPLRVLLDLGGSVAPFLGGELGYVVLPVHGQVDDGSALVAERGVWLSGGVGLAVAL